MTRPARSFVRFLAVGSAGFAIDAGLLWSLITLGGDPYLSRAVSFAVAMTVTWALNRRWTFRSTRRKSLHHEYAGYAAVQSAGIAVNFAIYALILSALGATAATAVVALAGGSVVALAVNYLGMKHLVFRTATS
ncbi:GtrA-like protein [Roseovarius sp. THAF27]|uniref:GtrA family protein n=1 Tax=Roseovarius sp. THAF27 TaxID=2587850 RepID=UPI0012679CEB|nr:GtrA family protein [Roseovarius sp. THAF27]QFT80429.1 GtrA-like protein [Roseovarius sp. THAF27]